MGRSGGSSGSSIQGLLGMMMLGILVFSGFLLLLLWPLIVLYGFLKRAYSVNKIKDIKPVPQSFWLSRQEKEEFREALDALAGGETVLARETAVFEALPHARRNKDGSYDKRSQAGRDNERQLAIVQETQRVLSYCRMAVSDLAEKPRERFTDWLNRIVEYKTYRFSAFFVFVCIPIYELAVLTHLGYQGSNALNIYVFYALSAPLSQVNGLIPAQEYLPFLFAQKYVGFEFLWKQWAMVMLVPPFLPLIPHAIYSSWCRSRIEGNAQAPPLVDIDNLDHYYVQGEEPKSASRPEKKSESVQRAANPVDQEPISANAGELTSRFEDVFEMVEDKIDTLSREESQSQEEVLFQMESPPEMIPQTKPLHILWRVAAAIVALFTVLLTWGGLAVIYENLIGKSESVIFALTIFVGIIASCIAAFYWLFKKAREQWHLWAWQFVGIVVITILGVWASP